MMLWKLIEEPKVKWDDSSFSWQRDNCKLENSFDSATSGSSLRIFWDLTSTVVLHESSLIPFSLSWQIFNVN